MYLNSEFAFLFAELYKAQPVVAQQIHAGAERGHWEKFLVDDQSRRETRQVAQKVSAPLVLRIICRCHGVYTYIRTRARAHTGTMFVDGSQGNNHGDKQIWETTRQGEEEDRGAKERRVTSWRDAQP